MNLKDFATALNKDMLGKNIVVKHPENLVEVSPQQAQPPVQTTQVVAPKPIPTKTIVVVHNDNVKEKVLPKAKPVAQTPNVAVPNSFAHHPFINTISRPLRKFELWFGNPSTGKTTAARNISQELVDNNVIKDFAVIQCHEEMTVMSMLKTTKTDESGAWIFILNKVFKFLTDELREKYVVIFDEINTLPMSVLKALQPLLDDTSGSFDFEDKTYIKNPNVFFIATMNHKDIGTSMLPEAIVSRAFPKFFADLTPKDLETRSKVPASFINILRSIHGMFSHLGNLHPFYNDVRQLKNLAGLTAEQFKEYITSHLELSNIDWQNAVAISPEFDNLIQQYTTIKW
jgi:DNA polymerase III delta prime subunit